MRWPAKTYICAFIASVSILVTAACGPDESGTYSEASSRRDLMRRYREGRHTLVVYGAADPKASSKVEELAGQLFSRRSGWQVTVQSDRETTHEELGETSVYLIGTHETNLWIENLSPDLPVSFENEGFRFLDEIYDDPSDILRLIYPNPLNSHLPLFLTLGNSEESLLEYFEVQRRGDYQVLRNGMTLVMGSFKQSTEGAWVVDSTTHRSFKREGEPLLTTEHFEYCMHFEAPAPDRLEALARKNEALHRRVEEFSGRRSNRKIRYHVYADSEEKGLVTNNTKSAHIDEISGDIHAVLEDDGLGSENTRTAARLLRQHLGRPNHQALELGLATYLASDRDHYEYHASRLALAGDVVPLAVLLDDESLEKESDFLIGPLAGSFVAFLIEGKNFDVHSKYATWNPSATEVETIELAWLAYLNSRIPNHRADIDNDRGAFPQPADSFQKGFTHAHEGYQIYDGYLSKRSDDALRKLASLGTDSIAIVPYTFMRDPNKAAHLPVPKSSGSENDEGVIHSIRTSKALGMTVMLKPQIWVQGGWPGDIEMVTEEDRRTFFEHYYRWMRHYALMAEREDVEILCIGTELLKMTAEHEVQWVDMIERLRKLYSGKLVYAANWDRELDGITFWNHLDYIGVNAYYPLSKKDNPSEEELKAGLDRALAQIHSVHERYRKPVLVTEVGFTSTPAPWKAPHESGRRRPVNLEDQARAYDIVFKGLLDAFTWVHGVYWWKWPSDLEHGGPRHTGFTPNGKPAENVVRKWYNLGSGVKSSKQ